MSNDLNTEAYDYIYPEALVATAPVRDFRTMWVQAGAPEPQEIQPSDIPSLFKSSDVLVINDTMVLKRRVTTPAGLEILFLSETERPNVWQVLFPAREVKDNAEIALPGNVMAKLLARGLPQTLEVSEKLDENYFNQHGELALPPYIQKARGQRYNRENEMHDYQTAWAETPGSLAAPTASLHFTSGDLTKIKNAGVTIVPLTLHVGLGTFLPVKSQILSEHKMHAEEIFIPRATTEKIIAAKATGHRVWALGTTAVRALESWGHGRLKETSAGDFAGASDLFITPGFKFEVVDAIMTNFHQPKSTLLALVSAWAGRERVLSAYEWAIARQFRLFSYGDFSIWTR